MSFSSNEVPGVDIILEYSFIYTLAAELYECFH
jgi:hypothetical protein